MPKRSRVRRSPAPFQVIAVELARQIRSGQLVAGEALPPRRSLAKKFGISINTLGKAIDDLVKQGLISATERHGTFVARDLASAASASASAVPAAAPLASPTAPVVGTLVALIVPMDGGETEPRMATERPREDRWALTVLRGLEAGLAEAGVRGRLYRVWPGDGEYPDLAAALAAADRDGADRLAIINVYNYPWIVAPMLALIYPRRRPVVCVAGVALDAAFPQVCYDQRQGGYLAGRHLGEAGYQRVVFARLARADWIEQRCEGMQRAIAQFGRRGVDSLAVALPGKLPTDVAMQNLPFPELQAKLDTWFAAAVASGALRSDGSSAVVLPSDRMAAALLGVLKARGLTPGRNLGVIGFDDDAGSCELGLSTVRPPLEQLGAFAARQLLTGAALVQHCLPSLVVPRDSTWRGVLS